jgi:hypothetical protein
MREEPGNFPYTDGVGIVQLGGETSEEFAHRLQAAELTGDDTSGYTAHNFEPVGTEIHFTDVASHAPEPSAPSFDDVMGSTHAPYRPPSDTSGLDRDRRERDRHDTQLREELDLVRRDRQKLISDNRALMTENKRNSDRRSYDIEKERRILSLGTRLIPAYEDIFYKNRIEEKINALIKKELQKETTSSKEKTDSELLKLVKTLITKNQPKKTSKKKVSKAKSKKKVSKAKSKKKVSKAKSKKKSKKK